MTHSFYLDILFLVGGLITVGLSFKWPRIATLLAVVAIPLYIVKFPHDLIPINYWEMIVLLLALTQWRYFYQVLSRLRLLKPVPLLGLVLVTVGLIIGTLVASDPLTALGIVKGWFIIPVILGLIIRKNIAVDSIWQIPFCLGLGALPLVVMALSQMISGNFITLDGRASGWFISANYLGLFLVPVILLLSRCIVSGIKSVRFLSTVIAVVAMVAVWGSHSFGSWLGLSAGLLILVAGIFNLKFSKVVIIGLGLGLLAGLGLYLVNDRFAQLLDLGQVTSASIRLQIWYTSLVMAKEHWLTGIGLGAFPAVYPQSVAKLFASPLEYLVLHPHNLFLAWAVNTGLVGLVGFVLIVIQWFRTVSQLSDRLWRSSLYASMTAILVHGLVDTTYFKNDLSAIFWIVVFLTITLYVPSSKSQTI